MEHKTIIDSNGFIVSGCEQVKDNKVLNIELQEGYLIVDFVGINVNKFIKPKWNGAEWEEGATEEEIQASKEGNNIIQEPTEQEKIISNIMLENAELKQQIAEISLQLAGLKGDK